MPFCPDRPVARRLALGALLLAATALAIALRVPLLRVGSIVLGASVLCFIACPLSRFYEKRLSRAAAALASLLSLGLCAGALLAVLLPGILREIIDLARVLPHSLRRLYGWIDLAREWLETRLPGIALPSLNGSGFEGLLTGVTSGAVGIAVNLADVAGRVSMMAVLAYFFLVDRDRLLLRAELLLPQAWRATAVRMGNAVCRALRLYLGGQLMIAAAVSVLACAALMLLGVRSALVLGLLIGLFNMIPYFGPFIGGVPAVLIALGDGWQKTLGTLAALILIQQFDGSWISPRIIGSLTGFSPAQVLVGIYAGACLGGIAGMLFALPAMLIIRTLFRVFVQKCENI